MNKQPVSAKDSALAFLISFCVCQMCVLAVSFFALFFCSIAKINTENLVAFFDTAVGYMISSIALNIGLILVFKHFNKNKDNSNFSKPKLTKTLIYIGIAIVAFFCLSPIVNCLDTLLNKWGVERNLIPYEINTKGYLISIISLVILPAVCEEMLFRGLIFKGLKQHGKILSIFISALMFAIFHMAIDQLIYPILMGMLLSYIMHKENNLFYTILIHAINNFLSLTVAYFNIPLSFNHWSYILLAIILVVIFVGVLLYLILKDKTNSEKTKMTPNGKFYFTICMVAMSIIWIIINIFKFL